MVFVTTLGRAKALGLSPKLHEPTGEDFALLRQKEFNPLYSTEVENKKRIIGVRDWLKKAGITLGASVPQPPVGLRKDDRIMVIYRSPDGQRVGVGMCNYHGAPA